MNDRVREFVDDVLAAPDELASVLDAHVEAIRDLPRDVLDRPRWRLVGLGSSRFAALDVAARLRATGHDVVAELASATASTPPGEDVLLVAISNSGRTREVVDTARRHAGRSAVIGLTGSPESPLAEVVDALIPLVAVRPESAGIASLSFRSTVAALLVLAGHATGDPHPSTLGAAVPALAQVLATRSGWLRGVVRQLETGAPVHVLGDGTRIGTVEQAALMLREAPRLRAAAFDTAEWLHVGLYTLLPGDPVLLLAGSAADGEVVATASARGGRVVAVGASLDGSAARIPLPDAALEDPAVRLLVEPAIAELLAAELWNRTDARTERESSSR